MKRREREQEMERNGGQKEPKEDKGKIYTQKETGDGINERGRALKGR